MSSPAHWALLYGEQIARGYLAPMAVVKVSEEVGLGVVATAPIARGALIGEYTGLWKRVPEKSESAYRYSFYGCWSQAILPFEIDAKFGGNATRFINHSKNANTIPQPVFSDGHWHMVFIANRDIAPGEPLLINYGRSYWTKDRPAPIELGQ